jgi:hypothetical protein
LQTFLFHKVRGPVEARTIRVNNNSLSLSCYTIRLCYYYCVSHAVPVVLYGNAVAPVRGKHHATLLRLLLPLLLLLRRRSERETKRGARAQTHRGHKQTAAATTVARTSENRLQPASRARVAERNPSSSCREYFKTTRFAHSNTGESNTPISQGKLLITRYCVTQISLG